jgi:hypothetical protein
MGAGASTVVPRATVETWDEEAVAQWVTGLGDAYVPYGASMKQKGVNGMKLLALEEKDLLELGVTPDHTKKLLSEKDRLNGAYYDTVNETHSTAEMREGDSAVITDGGRGVVLSFGAGDLSAELAGLEGISVSSGNSAASKLQARQRGNQARAEVKAQKDSAAKIQSIQRGKQVRTEIQQKQNSAAKIQAIQRGKSTRNVPKEDLAQKAELARVNEPRETTTEKKLTEGILLKTTTHKNARGKVEKYTYVVESAKVLPCMILPRRLHYIHPPRGNIANLKST